MPTTTPIAATALLQQDRAHAPAQGEPRHDCADDHRQIRECGNPGGTCHRDVMSLREIPSGWHRARAQATLHQQGVQMDSPHRANLAVNRQQFLDARPRGHWLRRDHLPRNLRQQARQGHRGREETLVDRKVHRHCGVPTKDPPAATPGRARRNVRGPKRHRLHPAPARGGRHDQRRAATMIPINSKPSRTRAMSSTNIVLAKKLIRSARITTRLAMMMESRAPTRSMIPPPTVAPMAEKMETREIAMPTPSGVVPKARSMSPFNGNQLADERGSTIANRGTPARSSPSFQPSSRLPALPDESHVCRTARIRTGNSAAAALYWPACSGVNRKVPCAKFFAARMHYANPASVLSQKFTAKLT